MKQKTTQAGNRFRRGALALALIFLTAPVVAAAADKEGVAETDKRTGAPLVRSLEQRLQQQEARLEELERLVKQQAALLELFQQQLAAQIMSQTAPQPVTARQSTSSLAAPAVASAAMVPSVVPSVTELAEPAASETDESGAPALESTGTVSGAEASAPAAAPEGKPGRFGNLSFSGEVRLRYEPFFGGVGPDRHRGRFRVRLNISSKFSDELSAGVRLTTGNDLEPLTSNQTFSDNFRRKPITIDQAFLRYKPRWFQPLSLVGGKFAYTWKRTELLYDNDINPEGLSQMLSFDLPNSVLSKVKLVGYQLVFRESGNGPDSYMVGGQLQTIWKLADRIKLSSFASYSNWQRADVIRIAQRAGELRIGANFNAASNSAFASRFGLFDLIAQMDVDTGVEKWPLQLVFDYVTNTRACAQAGSTGIACNARDRQGYWAEASVGRTQKPGDFRLGYAFIRLESEAVLGAFNYSDLRAHTNVVSHRFKFDYQINPGVIFGYTFLLGRQLNTAVTSFREPWLKRMQFDVKYLF